MRTMNLKFFFKSLTQLSELLINFIKIKNLQLVKNILK